MHRPQEQVREFCAAVVRAPTSPSMPMLREARLRARLIAEEAIEAMVGLVGQEDASEILADIHEKKRKSGALPDLAEAVDGLCDLIYVAYGAAEAIGIDLEPYFDEVHRTNMQKSCGAVDSYGKRGAKPPGWKPPRIREMLADEAQARWERRYRRW